MNSGLLTELAREAWMMEPRALGALFERLRCPMVLEMSSVDAAALGESDAGHTSRMSVADGVATIPISGLLLKQVPRWARMWGFDATGYGEIRQDLAAAIADPEVRSIRLHVRSPGGQVAGVKETADAIYEARSRKPIRAEIEDIGASAAYYLASQASQISAAENDQVGSIGTYSVLLSSAKFAEDLGFKVHVVASGPQKGVGVLGTDVRPDQFAPFQEVIDGMAAHFVRDVARGRGADLERVKGWADGRVWLAPQAAALGLVDRVHTTAVTPTSAPVRPAADSSPTKGAEGMEINDPAAGKIRADAAAEERKRVADVMAAFPQHPQFAMEQIQKGAGLVDAKAAFTDVLRDDNRRLASENESLRAAAKAGAVVPPAGGNSERNGYLDQAKAYAEAHKCSMRAALRHVSSSDPAAYEEYMVGIGAGSIIERHKEARRQAR